VFNVCIVNMLKAPDEPADENWFTVAATLL